MRMNKIFGVCAMKHLIEVYPFAYRKILDGQRKIDLRLYLKRFHNIQIGDTIEYVNAETKSCLQRKVKGIAVFQDFETLIEMMPPEMIGYSNREEIRLRVERMYTKEQQKEFGVCAFFLDEPDAAKIVKMNFMERSA